MRYRELRHLFVVAALACSLQGVVVRPGAADVCDSLEGLADYLEVVSPAGKNVSNAIGNLPLLNSITFIKSGICKSALNRAMGLEPNEALNRAILNKAIEDAWNETKSGKKSITPLSSAELVEVVADLTRVRDKLLRQVTQYDDPQLVRQGTEMVLDLDNMISELEEALWKAVTVALQMQKVSLEAEPEYKNATFQCIGDFEACKVRYKQNSSFDANFGCGIGYLICMGTKLIPFAD